MGNKFNRQILKKQVSSSAPAPVSTEGKKIRVGMDILTESSKAARASEMEIIYVTPDHITPSPKNSNISKNPDEIAELAESILHVGLLNPLVVRETEPGQYMIVCGERRFLATQKNIEDGRRSPEEPLKCHLFNPDLIDLPLTDDEKEDYVRDVENAQQRNKTEADKYSLIRRYEERYQLLRERDPERFHGLKTRTMLARDLNMGESSIAQFKKVDNQGSEELKQALREGQVKISTAVDIASMEKGKQAELINEALKTTSVASKNGSSPEITKKDVLKFKHAEKKASAGKSEAQEPEGLITEKILKKDLREIFKHLKEKEREGTGIQLNEQEYVSYLRLLKNLENLLR